MLTLEDILKTDAFKEAKLISGKSNFKQNIINVTVAEVPDAANWLRGGELICTTAYFISKKVNHQIQWIKSLSENNAAALAVKSDRFLGEIPKYIIEFSNDLNFPIIELSPEVTWPEVIESVMNPLLNNQVNSLKKTEAVYNKLINLVLNNYSIKQIINEISFLTNCLILFNDVNFMSPILSTTNVLSKSSFQDISEDKKTNNFFRKKIYNSSYYKKVIVGDSKKELELSTTLEGYKVKSITRPVFSERVTHGFITLIDFSEEIEPIKKVILNHGANAIALQLMKEEVRKKTNKNENLLLVDDLINGRINSDLIEKYKIQYLERKKMSFIVLIKVEYVENEFINEKIKDDINDEISNIVKRKLLEYYSQVTIVYKDKKFIIIIDQLTDKKIKLNRLKKLLHKGLKVCQEEKKVINSYMGGIGNSYSNLTDLEHSFKEAEKSLFVTSYTQFKNNECILSYNELGINKIILMIDNQKKLNEFCNEVLGTLFKYDKQKKEYLLETLYIYLKCNCNTAITAEKLYIHANTVNYRIRKIKDDPNVDLNSIEAKMSYLLALEIYYMITHI